MTFQGQMKGRKGVRAKNDRIFLMFTGSQNQNVISAHLPMTTAKVLLKHIHFQNPSGVCVSLGKWSK